jgi:hypothetical protein
MTLDIFDIKLGTEKKPYLTSENTGLVAVQMLDAVQTIVDVLTDAEGGGWKVSFDPGMSAYTERVGGKRNICISVKPLLDAPSGTPLSDIAAVMTGFAVHEIGHTKLDYFTAVRARWPGKQLPITLANIIEDVVLELRTVDRYNGFADHGRGTIFDPALNWVAKRTCPTYPLKWEGTSGHKVNVVGQMLRYKGFVSYSPDAKTQAALAWIDLWSVGIHKDLTPKGCVALIEDVLAYMKATHEDEPEPVTEPEPEPTEGGEDSGQSLPNEDPDDTEGDDGDGDGSDGDDGDTEGDDGDSDSDGDGDGEDGDGNGTEGDGEDTGSGGMDSDTEGGDSDDGDPDGDGEGEGDKSGDGNDADHGSRVNAGKGTNDGDGAGGSGQAVAEAGDDVDEGFDPDDLNPTFDEVSKADKHDAGQARINHAEREERTTVRVDAGAHGKMRVIFQ